MAVRNQTYATAALTDEELTTFLESVRFTSEELKQLGWGQGTGRYPVARGRPKKDAERGKANPSP